MSFYIATFYCRTSLSSNPLVFLKVAAAFTEISIGIIFDISVSISQNRVIDCFHSMSIADSFTTAIWTGKKLPFKLNIVVSFTIFCRNKEIFQIRISDIENSCDKNSIRNHRVPPFVIRVLCLNTLYAKGYFFYQPDILECQIKERACTCRLAFASSLLIRKEMI